jgi:thioredoxin-like negative regulator of GroEL
MGDSPENRSRDSISPAGMPPAMTRLSEGEFQHQLANTTGASIVLFTSPSCRACDAWKHILPKALTGIAGQVFELDVVEATGIARYYGIFHLPTIYLYRDGVFQAAVQCALQADVIRQTVAGLLLGPAQDEP